MEEEQQAQMPDNDQNGQQYSEAAAAEGGEEMEGQETSEMGGDGDSPDDDDKKLFVGGLSWETTQKDLKEYFQKFGEVASCTLKTDVETRRSRGFGFVVFAEATTVDKVLEEKVHKLHGRQIDPKKANPRGKEPQKKIYVGKVNPTTTEETIREYFEKYGKVTKIELPFNRNEDKRRDFVFVEFDLEETVQKVLGSHKIDETDCEVKVATPNTNNRGRGRGMGFWRGGDRGRGRGRGGYGGGWNDYSGDYYGYGQGGYGGYGGYNNNYYDQNYYQGYGNQGWGGYDNSYYNNYYGGGGGGGYDQYWNQGQQNTNYGKAQKRGGGGHSGYRPY